MSSYPDGRYTWFSTSLWLARLANVQEGRPLEGGFVALNNTGIHCHTHQNTDPPHTPDTQRKSPTVSALEGSTDTDSYESCSKMEITIFTHIEIQ